MAVTNRFTNGSFEDGFTGWTVVNTYPDVNEALIQGGAYDGAYQVNTRVVGNHGYIGLRQNVDLTGVHEISIALRFNLGTFGRDEDFYIGLYIDGALIKYVTNKITGMWIWLVAPISGYSGIHTVEFRHVANTYNTSYNCTISLDDALALTRWAEPTAYFNVSTESGPAPLTVQFYNGSSGYPTPTYVWDFGDGSPTSTASNPSHTYTHSGQYTVTLTVTNPLGLTAYTRSISVSGLPSVDFRPIPPGGGRGTTVTFKNLTTAYPAITSWAWWFEGGQYPSAPDSTVFEPQHTYLEEGEYTVRLRATNALGTITTTKVNCITITPDLTSKTALNNVAIIVGDQLIWRTRL